MADIAFVGDAGFDGPFVLVHVERGDGGDWFGGCVGAHNGCRGAAVIGIGSGGSVGVGMGVVVVVIRVGVGIVGLWLDESIISGRFRTGGHIADFRASNDTAGVLKRIKGQDNNECLILHIINHKIFDLDDRHFADRSAFDMNVVLGGEHSVCFVVSVGEDGTVALVSGGFYRHYFEDLDAWGEGSALIILYHLRDGICS